MPIEVEVPDVGIVEFPDEMKPEEIQGALRTKFSRQQATSPNIQQPATNSPNQTAPAQPAAKTSNDLMQDLLANNPQYAKPIDAGQLQKDFESSPEGQAQKKAVEVESFVRNYARSDAGMEFTKGTGRLDQFSKDFQKQYPDIDPKIAEEEYKGWATAYKFAPNFNDRLGGLLGVQEATVNQVPKEHLDKFYAAVQDLAGKDKPNDANWLSHRGMAFLEGGMHRGAANMLMSPVGGGVSPQDAAATERARAALQEGSPVPNDLTMKIAGNIEPMVSSVGGTAMTGSHLAGTTMGFGPDIYANRLQQAKQNGLSDPAAHLTAALSTVVETGIYAGLPGEMLPKYGGAAAISRTAQESIQKSILENAFRRIGTSAAKGATVGFSATAAAETIEQVAKKITGNGPIEDQEIVKRAMQSAWDNAGITAALSSPAAVMEAWAKANPEKVAELAKKDKLSRSDAEKAVGVSGTSEANRAALLDAIKSQQAEAPPQAKKVENVEKPEEAPEAEVAPAQQADQAGQTDVGGEKGGVQEDAPGPEGLLDSPTETWKNITGKDWDKGTAEGLVGGGAPGVRVGWSDLSGNELLGWVSGDGFKATRTIKKGRDGKIQLSNDDVFVDKSARGRGLLSDMLSRQVESAEKLGIEKISAFGQRGGDNGGYYALPRIGYDAPLPDKVKGVLPDSLKDAGTVQDLMATDEGRAWWKENGVPLDMEFDTRPGSKSRQILDQGRKSEQSPKAPRSPENEVDSAPSPDVISIKNRIVKELRAGRGDVPLQDAQPESEQQWLDEAAAKMQSDPLYVEGLIDELKKESRPHTDMEAAALTIRKQQLNQQFTDAAKQQIEARKSDNKKALDEATKNAAAARSRLQELDVVSKAAGTETGRGLRARQIEIANDSTPAALSLRRSEARGGAELSPEDQAKENEEVTRQSEDIQAAQSKLDKHLAEAAEKPINEKIEQQIAEDKPEVDQRKSERRAERKRGTYRERLENLWNTAKTSGLNPDALQERAKQMAEEEAKENEEYNQQLRGLQKDMRASQAKLEAARNKGADSTSIIDSRMARQMAERYPDLGIRPTPEGAEETEDFQQQIIDVIDKGPRTVPQWVDRLQDAAQSMVSSREEAASRGDAYEEPGGGFPDTPFNPDEFELKDEPPPPKAKGAKEHRSDRVKAAKQKANEALKKYKDITAKNKGVYLGSTKIVPDILLDPERLSAAVDVVKAYVELGYTRLSQVWADVKDNLKGLGNKPEEDYPHFVAAWKREMAEGNVESPVKNEEDFEEISRLAREIQRDVIDGGTTEREAVVDAVHEELKGFLPDMTRRDTKLALSRYGKYRELPKDELSVKQREINGELQQLLKLEDMEQGRAPLKTGMENRDPSDEERRLLKLVNEKKKEGGFTVTDPAKALKSALDSAKTAARNRIKDLEREISSREKVVKQRSTLEPDQELIDLRKQRDTLQSAHDEIFAKSKTDAERIAAANRALDASITRLSDDLASNKLSAKKKPSVPFTAELEAKRDRLAALRAMRDEVRLYDPKYQAELAAKQAAVKEKAADIREIQKGLEPSAEAKQTAAYKRNLTKRIAELAERKADMERTGKIPPKKEANKTVLDEKAVELKLNLEKKWQEVRAAEDKIRQANRSRREKAVDFLGKFGVAGALSHITTLAKLAGAAAARIGTIPLEEAIGGAISKLPLIKRIAEKSPGEGAGGQAAFWKSLWTGFTSPADEFLQTLETLRTGKGDIDTLYGIPRGDAHTILDYIGHLHAAMKSPVKRLAFRMQYEKRMKYYQRATDAKGQPIDVSDPLVQMRIGAEAYKDSLRSVFMQPNRLAQSITAFFEAKVDPKTGKASMPQRVKEAAGRILFPVRTVPLNIVGETLTYATGAAAGGLQVLYRLHQAGFNLDRFAEGLKPEEADQIMRLLKKGSIGAAFLYLGYANPDSIGGFYQYNKKKKNDDVEFGGMKLFGNDVPKVLLHNPLLECLQVGATIRKVSDEYINKKDSSALNSMDHAITAVGLGLAEETPFSHSVADITKMRQGQETIGSYLEDRFTPGIASDVYKFLNPPEPKKKPIRTWR